MISSRISTRAPRTRKHALAGNGLIVDRARRALRHVAEQFGEVGRITQTTVEVRTHDGIDLTLSYNPGNYVFSRVYNLTVTAALPEASAAPSAVELTFKGGEAHYIRKDGGDSAALGRLNRVARPHLSKIDMHSSSIGKERGVRRITVVPLGGAYVWVLIPPVFKATAFPPGEPDRILDLIRAVRGLGVDPVDPQDP